MPADPDTPFTTNIPQRMDRLTWARWHWLVVGALGITWLLDGLEVSIVASLGPVLTLPDTLHLTQSEVGLTASAYLAGSVMGALLFSYLTDRQGRKKWFMIPLALYLAATLMTAFSWDLLSFMFFRFLTGAGIGGEYAAINSAIDEIADALNAGLNLARAPIVCSMDADSILEPDALLRAVQPFVEDPENVVATGGTVRIANGCVVKDGRVVEIGVPSNFLALVQTVEYLRAFLLARLAWSKVGALTIVSGAFGLFRRSVLLEIGGYALKTVGEDMELIVRLHRHFRERRKPYRIAFVPEPVCWTEAPETLSVLARQRARWHRGALETFFKHRVMLFNPRYGAAGLIGWPSLVLFDFLGLFIEAFGYLSLPVFAALQILSYKYLLLFLAIAFGYGALVSVLHPQPGPASRDDNICPLFCKQECGRLSQCRTWRL